MVERLRFEGGGAPLDRVGATRPWGSPQSRAGGRIPGRRRGRRAGDGAPLSHGARVRAGPELASGSTLRRYGSQPDCLEGQGRGALEPGGAQPPFSLSFRAWREVEGHLAPPVLLGEAVQERGEDVADRKPGKEEPKQVEDGPHGRECTPFRAWIGTGPRAALNTLRASLRREALGPLPRGEGEVWPALLLLVQRGHLEQGAETLANTRGAEARSAATSRTHRGCARITGPYTQQPSTAVKGTSAAPACQRTTR
jgi:hypothetical protein